MKKAPVVVILLAAGLLFFWFSKNAEQPDAERLEEAGGIASTSPIISKPEREQDTVVDSKIKEEVINKPAPAEKPAVKIPPKSEPAKKVDVVIHEQIKPNPVATETVSALKTESSVPTASTSSEVVTTSSAPEPAGAIVSYTFDSSSISGSTIKDASGNGSDASSAITPRLTSGIHGDALSLNGLGGEYAILQRSEKFDLSTAPLTVSLWVKLNDLGVYQALVAQSAASNRLTLAYSPATGLVLGSGYLSGSYVEQGKPSAWDLSWHHVALVAESSLFSLYFDGSLVATSRRPDYTILSGGVIWLGAAKYGNDPRDYANGSFDDMRVYARALSADEITRLSAK